ncbi:MAG: TA system VapC family ribonuclease toxin [Rhodothermales bacterium]
MFVVDTNVLLYAADRAAPEHEKCHRHLQAWRERTAPWYLTWGIVYEFLRVATHPRVLKSPWSTGEAWNFVEALLAAPGADVLKETDRHREVVAEVLRELPDLRGNILFDARTAILMREHGIKTIYTRDTDFNRFPFLEVVDPVSDSRRRS